MKNTGSHFLTSDGENTTSYCTTGSPWRRTQTRFRELKEIRLRIIGFSQQILKEELGFHSINVPTLLKQKEKCKRLHDEHLARTQQEYRDIPPSQQTRQRKGNNLKATETLTTSLTRTQVGDSTYSRGETCRHLRRAREPSCKQLRHRRQRGTKPSGRRATGNLSTLQILTRGDFSHSQDRFRLPGKKPPSQPMECVTSTPHKYSTYRVAHSVITFHHESTRGSRIAHCLCPSNNCHPRDMSHVPLFASSPIFPLTSQTPQHFWSTMNIWDQMNDHNATISDRVAVSRRQSLRQRREGEGKRARREGEGKQEGKERESKKERRGTRGGERKRILLHTFIYEKEAYILTI